MNRRRLILLGVVFLVAAGMAFYLQDFVRAVLFEPLSYLAWGLNIVYQSVAQLVYWILLVTGFTLMAFGSLYGKGPGRESVEGEKSSSHGPLENVSRQISRAGEGMYYKWLIANRLGKLARSILTLRGGQTARSHDALDGRDWDPPDEVAAYLVSGLTRTFADYPRPRWFARPQETPFDVDLDRVVAFLESQMENQRD